jgi:predicted  nucleic acid-binding Zn-ribbon protein
MSAAFGLFRLQQVDNRISQIEARLAKVHEALENDSELQLALGQVSQAEQEQRSAEQSRREAEHEAQGLQVKIQQAESSLYSGSVHNPKELQDIQAEVVSLKKHLATLEERELAAMLQVETAEASLQTVESGLKQTRARFTSEYGKLNADLESLRRERNDLDEERQAAVSAIPAELLSTYEELRQQRRGVAVAVASDNGCSACGTTLTAAVQQSARHSPQLVHCPSCGRILYGA